MRESGLSDSVGGLIRPPASKWLRGRFNAQGRWRCQIPRHYPSEIVIFTNHLISGLCSCYRPAGRSSRAIGTNLADYHSLERLNLAHALFERLSAVVSREWGFFPKCENVPLFVADRVDAGYTVEVARRGHAAAVIAGGGKAHFVGCSP